MDQQIAFFEVFRTNPITGESTWLGTATRAAAAKVGPNVVISHLLGYEQAEKFPSGWACRAK
jgi:hypothetical protein